MGASDQVKLCAHCDSEMEVCPTCHLYVCPDCEQPEHGWDHDLERQEFDEETDADER